MSNYSATYSPEDNKLRLYSLHRLDDDLYKRVSEAGFRFAPKQDLFVAPMWTPGREDLLLELCGEIGDEDTSLVERAEVRADRFEDYRESRTREGDAAYAGVQSMTENIPLGQPILVGHHSERRARRDAERIESGMRRAVNAWDTAEYWTRRAKGAMAHAKYKERPDVRHRRIKGLEADRRKYQKEIDNATSYSKLWSKPDLSLDRAKAIAAYDHVYFKVDGQVTSLYSMLGAEGADIEQIRERALKAHARTIASYGRWIAHVDNRLAYERAMLGESGGIAADQFEVTVGGSVLVRGDWLVVKRVNRVQGRINSLTTTPPRVMNALGRWKVSIEEVKDYRAPDPAEAAAAAKATKTPPIVNYPGEGFVEMTKDEWNQRNDDCKSIRKIAATDTHGAYRVRRALLPNEGYALRQVFLTDSKRVERPVAVPVTPDDVQQLEPTCDTTPTTPAIQPPPLDNPRRARAEQLREALREGVQVVSAPQLFATPAPTAGRMADEADIQPGDHVGEFSAGTGRILNAISEVIDFSEIQVTAIEINGNLARALTDRFPSARVQCADFMACGEELGKFDKIIINPPFANGQDIAHITRAFGMLKPGGRLVAICANGPRQNEKLRPLVEERDGLWEELPPDTFAESGTGVRTVLLRIDA